ncbi:caffeine-induced death protein 2 [Rhypophila decipiens]|uniref:Caffeine-induced death protein 2 n=1 Tax=Rhypophila decipiens TaxID=261697 RepID=A0AAN6YA84_9PEZI|nr:caffeine-induced death protein 2 [Rhypophila decipiens]
MANPPSSPELSPKFCFSTAALRDFLRVSRSSVDDTITQHLNALVVPSRVGFDPSSTSLRGARPPSRQIDSTSCQSFQDKVLFPAWQTRSHVLSYCALVATSPDPDDPEAAIRESENEKNRERVVDERLDPYSARYFPREPRTEQLASAIRMEQGIENIVRRRTWDIVKGRCGESAVTWEEALADWRKKQEVRQKSAVSK